MKYITQHPIKKSGWIPRKLICKVIAWLDRRDSL